MIFRRNYSPARRSPRQWWNTSVEVFTEQAHMNALGVNISDGGMCLFAVADFPVGSKIEIKFRAQHAARPVKRNATVRHRALYLYGVEFVPELERETAEITTGERA